MRPNERQTLLTVAEALAITGYKSRSSIYRLVKQGRFPCPVSVGCNQIRWRSGDVEEWLNSLQVRRY